MKPFSLGREGLGLQPMAWWLGGYIPWWLGGYWPQDAYTAVEGSGQVEW